MLFLYCMEKDETKKKKTNHWQAWSEGILIFHGQLNWYIFHTLLLRIKMGFIYTGLIIISCNISNYVHKSHFYFIRKRWF